MNATRHLPDLLPPAADTDTIPVFVRWFGSWRVSVQRQAFSAPQLTAAYDRAAGKWDRTVTRLGMPTGYATVLDTALNDAPTPDRVLDCGIGTGALSRALAGLLPAGAQLDGVDIAPGMLDEAARNLRQTSLRTAMHQADARALPFADDTFDVVMTAHMLEHLPDPAAVATELFRVLKPGGRMIVWVTRRSPLGMYIHLKWRTHRFTPSGATSLLVDAGLSDVRVLASRRGSLCRTLSVACMGRKPV